MTKTPRDSAVTQIVELLTRYSFEVQGYTVQGIVAQWLTRYCATWVRLAIVEALYLGRYKAVSIEQILAGWERQKNPKIHFDREFECLICCKLPQKLATSSTPSSKRIKKKPKLEPSRQATTKVPSATSTAPSRQQLSYSSPAAGASLLPRSRVQPPSVTHGGVVRQKVGYALGANGQQLGDRPQAVSDTMPDAAHSQRAMSAAEFEAIEIADLAASMPGSDLSRPRCQGQAASKKQLASKDTLHRSSKVSKSQTSKHSIERFVPLPDASQFYSKLRAVADYTEP